MSSHRSHQLLPRMDLEKCVDLRFNFLLRFRTWLKPLSPITTWMNYVPGRSFLLMPARARIMVSKPVNLEVPEGLKPIYEHRLGKRNPDVIHNQVPTLKVTNVEIRRLYNRVSVFRKSIE